MKKIGLAAVFFLLILQINAQSVIQRPGIKWMTIQQAKDTFVVRQKPIMIFLYDSQDSSKLMMDSVFADKQIENYMDIFFYCVKIDVATKRDLRFFNDSLFRYNPALKVHPFANFLTNGQNHYPAMVMFRKDGTGELFSGYYDVTHIFPILIYYAEEAYRTVTYADYLKYFRMVYPEKSATGYTMVRSVTKWHTLPEAIELQKQNPKKILIDFYLNERNLSTMQYMRTYNDAEIGQYINEHFYAVHLNGTTKDTINAFGDVYTNPETPYPFHQLVIAMLNGVMYFPTLMLLDENDKMLDRIQAYLRPQDIEPILHFYAEDAYKTQSFSDFKKTFKSELSVPQN